jgi:hypothetical protein
MIRHQTRRVYLLWRRHMSHQLGQRRISRRSRHQDQRRILRQGRRSSGPTIRRSTHPFVRRHRLPTHRLRNHRQCQLEIRQMHRRHLVRSATGRRRSRLWDHQGRRQMCQLIPGSRPKSRRINQHGPRRTFRRKTQRTNRRPDLAVTEKAGAGRVAAGSLVLALSPQSRNPVNINLRRMTKLMERLAEAGKLHVTVKTSGPLQWMQWTQPAKQRMPCLREMIIEMLKLNRP